MEFTQILLSSPNEKLQTLIGVFFTFLIIFFMYLSTWFYAKRISMQKQLKTGTAETVHEVKRATQEAERIARDVAEKCETRYKILTANYSIQLQVSAARRRQIMSLERQLAKNEADRKREILALQEKIDILETLTLKTAAMVERGQNDET